MATAACVTAASVAGAVHPVDLARDEGRVALDLDQVEAPRRADHLVEHAGSWRPPRARGCCGGTACSPCSRRCPRSGAAHGGWPWAEANRVRSRRARPAAPTPRTRASPGCRSGSTAASSCRWCATPRAGSPRSRSWSGCRAEATRARARTSPGTRSTRSSSSAAPATSRGSAGSARSTSSPRCWGWPTSSRSSRSARAPATTAGGRSRARRSTSRCARTASRSRTPSAVRREPVTFVVSTRIDDAAGVASLRALRGMDPTLRFKLDPVPGWDDAVLAELASLGRRRRGRHEGALPQRDRGDGAGPRALPARVRGAARGMDRGPRPGRTTPPSCSSATATGSPGTCRSARSATSRPCRGRPAT